MSLLLALAFAQAERPTIEVRQPSSCTIARAERVTFPQLHRDLERLHGRCVALRGIWSRRALYNGEAVSRGPRAEYDAANAADRVGLYGSIAIERGTREPDAYLAVGLLRDCAALWDGTDAVGGYCHNNPRGPFLLVTDLRRRHWPTIRGPW